MNKILQFSLSFVGSSYFTSVAMLHRVYGRNSLSLKTINSSYFEGLQRLLHLIFISALLQCYCRTIVFYCFYCCFYYCWMPMLITAGLFLSFFFSFCLVNFCILSHFWSYRSALVFALQIFSQSQFFSQFAFELPHSENENFFRFAFSGE